MSDDTEDPKFHLTYNVACHMPPIGPEEVTQGDGACTAIVNVCISEQEDSHSYIFTSVDGRTGEELVPEQFFQAWRMMAKYLEGTLKDGGAQELCAEVVRVMESAEAQARDNN